MTTKLFALLGLGLLACAQSGFKGCENGALLDPVRNNKPFACFGSDKKTLHLTNGYTAEQALSLMWDRENNAWTQLANAIERQERVNYSRELAARGREEYGKSPRVHDITKVIVTKTIDKETFVIGLSTDDGRTASLWLDGGEVGKGWRVRSVSPY